MAGECNGMTCKRNICCGICEEKSTCSSACKSCVPPNVTATTESNTDAHTEDSSDED